MSHTRRLSGGGAGRSQPGRAKPAPPSACSGPGSRRISYDEEGERLVRRMSATASGRSAVESPYHNLDEIYSDVSSGGRVYVGNLRAASSLELLRHHNITNVVNCMDPTSANFHESDRDMKYLRFPIAHFWREPGMGSGAGVVQYFGRMFQWVDAAVARGEGVLIHCLAGAHRAGTTGVSYLMHTLGLPATAATAVARRARPCIDPIGDFPALLRRLQHGMEMQTPSAERPSRGGGGGQGKPAVAGRSSSGLRRQGSASRGFRDLIKSSSGVWR